MHFWDASQWDKMCFDHQRIKFQWKMNQNFHICLQSGPRGLTRPLRSFFDDFPTSAINVFSSHLSKTKTKISLVKTTHKIHFMGGKSTKSRGGEGEGGLQCWCPWPRFISGVNILLFQAFCAWSLIIPWIFSEYWTEGSVWIALTGKHGHASGSKSAKCTSDQSARSVSAVG